MTLFSQLVPNASLVTADSTQTLANKTLNSPILVTPNLGTPSAGVLTNATGLPIVAGTTGTLSVSRGGIGVTTLTANAVVIGNGTSAVTAVAPGATGNVLISNGTSWTSAAPAAPAASGSALQAIASGSLNNGSTVIINADGTVSIVTSAPGTLSAGNTVEFLNTEIGSENSAVYDIAQQKVVIFYRGFGGNGTAIVGTVSGTSISFGTPVIFASVYCSYISATYAVTEQKVVLTYADYSLGVAIVGTVSGTDISFGTPVTFNPTSTYYLSTVYDTAQQKVVTVYNVNGVGTAIVGTVSGTDISFGTPVGFETDYAMNVPAAVYASASQKVIIAYRRAAAPTYSGFGTAIVGTVLGTDIYFSTTVVFNSAYTDSIFAGYDVSSQKVVIAYRDGDALNFGFASVGTISVATNSISFGTRVGFTTGDTYSVSVVSFVGSFVISYMEGGNSYVGTARVGNVSGTSITFGTPVVFDPSNPADSITSTFDSTQQKIVVAYRGGAMDTGKSVVLQEATPGGSNLTAENFIGFSSAAYTNGQTATIQIVGAVNDSQSGLTPGQSYYVQPSGGLGLTPGTPSVFAGTAVANTKIIIKG